MAGTSADGVDAALLEFNELGLVGRIASHFEPYSADERSEILGNMGRWDVSPKTLEAIHSAHNRALSQLPEADCVAFHGQTLNHDPKNGRTLQAGAPDALMTSAKVVYDFRTRDVQSGGEGAPLIPIYHYALAKELGFDEPVEFINIGGVSNVTYVNPNLPPEEGLLAFDVGVGNAMSDDLMQYFYGRDYDEGGAMALKGRVNADWLEQALSAPFFAQTPPKSLDRLSLYRDFDALKTMKAEDALATAIAFTVAGIELATPFYPTKPTTRILCGGGRHNEALKSTLNARNIDDYGIGGDMIEAEGFAYLAWAFLNDRPASFPLTTRVSEPTLAGKLLS